MNIEVMLMISPAIRPPRMAPGNEPTPPITTTTKVFASITSMFNPGYSYVMLFVAMTLVLVLRPYGLLGTVGRE